MFGRSSSSTSRIACFDIEHETARSTKKPHNSLESPALEVAFETQTAPARCGIDHRGFQSRYASCAPTCKLVFPGEYRSNCAASHWNHSKVFCEPLRRRSSSM